MPRLVFNGFLPGDMGWSVTFDFVIRPNRK